MIRYLIKNNFKIMFRSATNIMILILAPLAIMAVLSSAFSALMDKYEDVGSFKAGYRIETNDSFISVDIFTTSAAEEGITFVEYKTGEPKDIIKENKLGGFVIFGKDSEGKDYYTVYENDDSDGEGQILEYLLHAFYENITTMIIEFNDQIPDAEDETTDPARLFTTETADFIPAVNSTDYYGIIYIIYFSWCTIVCGAGLLASEKKYRIGKKITVSGISELKSYFAKFIPLVLVVILGISLSAVISMFLFGVNWGNVAMSGLLVLVGILATTAMGLMFYAIFDNMVITVIAVFMLVWTAGFIGGSFETYLFSSFSDALKHLSPIYYENRACVEISSMGSSDYFTKSLIFSGTIAVACSCIAVLAGKIRRGRTA